LGKNPRGRKAIYTLANKIARVAWAVLTRRTAYSLFQQPS
jgi:hypothetical protein